MSSNWVVSTLVRVALAAMVGLLPTWSRPLHGQALERILRIGVVDGPDEYTFGRIGGISLLADGEILVLDVADAQARVYGSAGDFLFSFGRRGSGPGEFMAPTAPVVTPTSIQIYDTQLKRLVTFDRRGRHIETSPFVPGVPRLTRLRVVRSGRWMAQDAGFDSREVLELMAGTREREEVGLRNVYLISGTDLDTVARFRPGSVFWYDAANGFPLGPYTGSTPGPELLWDISGDSLVVVVDAVRGRVRWLLAASDGLEQITERDLRLPERPLELPFLDSLAAAKRRDGVRRVGFIRPTHNPYFGRALLDDRGAVWLRRSPEANSNAQDSTTYLVVAMAGQEPFGVTLPPSFTPATITSTLVIGVYHNELDVEFVDIYRWSGR